MAFIRPIMRSPKIARERAALGPASCWIREPGHEQHLETVAQAIGENAHDAEAPVEEMGEAEGKRKSERGLGAALVAEPPAASRALDEASALRKRACTRRGRRRASRQDVENHVAFLIAERHEADGEAVAIGERHLRGVAAARRRDPGLIGRDRALRRRGREVVLARRRLDGLAHLGIGERQHPVAQDLIDGRQAGRARGDG